MVLYVLLFTKLLCFSLTRSGAPSAPPLRPAAPVSSAPAKASDKQLPAPRKARALYDYDAADSTELSLLADEVMPILSSQYQF